MKFTKIPETTFKEIQPGAGILTDTFDPVSAKTAVPFAATTGGLNFSAVPAFVDFGENIDNCPKNTKELKKLQSWEIKLSGSFVSLKPETAKKLMAAADISGNKITPRNDLAAEDFADLWLVADYSDKNGATNGGFVAIHMMNALSTGGFSMKTTDKEKGEFAFEFTAHYSIAEQDVVPFEVYIEAGQPEA